MAPPLMFDIDRSSPTPLYHQLVADGTLPGGIACDDGAAAHFVDDQLAELIVDREGAGAYRVEPGDETRLDTRRLTCRIERGARDLLDADAAIGAGDRKHAIGEFDVGLGRLEQMRGDAPALVDDLDNGAGERGSADRDRARPERAGAVRHLVGVAFDHLHARRRHAEA